MKAVIVDIRKKQAAALDESGRVVRIHSAGYELGQTIELHEVKPVRAPQMLKRLSFGVAAAVLAVMIGTGTAYATPYGTVTLDGDSAIEYTINCFDYVIDVKATNEEGEALLSEIDTSQLRHHRIDAAVATTVEHMEQPKTELHISAETRADRHSDRLLENLEPLIERETPAPQEGDSGPETPHAEGDMLSTEPGQFPGSEESLSRDGIQPGAPAPDDGPASDGAALYNPLTDNMGNHKPDDFPGQEGEAFEMNGQSPDMNVQTPKQPDMGGLLAELPEK